MRRRCVERQRRTASLSGRRPTLPCIRYVLFSLENRGASPAAATPATRQIGRHSSYRSLFAIGFGLPQLRSVRAPPGGPAPKSHGNPHFANARNLSLGTDTAFMARALHAVVTGLRPSAIIELRPAFARPANA